MNVLPAPVPPVKDIALSELLVLLPMFKQPGSANVNVLLLLIFISFAAVVMESIVSSPYTPDNMHPETTHKEIIRDSFDPNSPTIVTSVQCHMRLSICKIGTNITYK